LQPKVEPEPHLTGEEVGFMSKKIEPIQCHTPAGNDRFGQFASSASYWLGSKWAFIIAGLIIVVWGVTGRYSATRIPGNW